MAVMLIFIYLFLFSFFLINMEFAISQHCHIIGNKHLHFVDYSLACVRLQLSSPITRVHDRFSTGGSRPPIIGIHGVLANQKQTTSITTTKDHVTC
jgi:hypothetical protein